VFGTAVEDYLKTIYKLSLSLDRVTPSAVAERQAVSLAAAMKMIRRLQERKLVRYQRKDGVDLTAAGTKVALEMVRHHRLIELYLKEALGYTWDQVDEEAERLEHVISEEFEDKIDALLGYPTHDPHGAPIPTKEGEIDLTRHPALADLEPGLPARVEQVHDGDPARLRYLGELGLYPDARVELIARGPFGGPLRLRVEGRERTVGEELARHVFVSRLEE
jgi:DtxR family Mn-dependent transcriptional regulator